MNGCACNLNGTRYPASVLEVTRLLSYLLIRDLVQLTLVVAIKIYDNESGLSTFLTVFEKVGMIKKKVFVGILSLFHFFSAAGKHNIHILN